MKLSLSHLLVAATLASLSVPAPAKPRDPFGSPQGTAYQPESPRAQNALPEHVVMFQRDNQYRWSRTIVVIGSKDRRSGKVYVEDVLNPKLHPMVRPQKNRPAKVTTFWSSRLGDYPAFTRTVKAKGLFSLPYANHSLAGLCDAETTLRAQLGTHAFQYSSGGGGCIPVPSFGHVTQADKDHFKSIAQWVGGLKKLAHTPISEKEFNSRLDSTYRRGR